MRSGRTSSPSSLRAGPSPPTRLQQMHPLRISLTPDMEPSEASFESTATSPNSILNNTSLYSGLAERSCGIKKRKNNKKPKPKKPKKKKKEKGTKKSTRLP